MAEGGYKHLLTKKSEKSGAIPNRYEEKPASVRPRGQVSLSCPTCGQQVKVRGVSGSPVSGVSHTCTCTPADGRDTEQNYRPVGNRFPHGGQREGLHHTCRQQVDQKGETSAPCTGVPVAVSESKHRYCSVPGITGSVPLKPLCRECGQTVDGEGAVCAHNNHTCGTPLNLKPLCRECGGTVDGEGAVCAHNNHTCGTPEDGKQGEDKTPQNITPEMAESVFKKLTTLEESRRVATTEKTEVETQILKLKEEAIRNIEDSAKTLVEQVRLIFDRWEEGVKNEVEDLTSSLQSCHGSGRQNYDGTKTQLNAKLQRHAPKPPTVEFVPKGFKGFDFTLGQIQVKKVKEVGPPRQDVLSTPSRTFTSWKSRFGTSGTKTGQFLEPLCVTAALDQVYVIDRAGGGRVQVFTLRGVQVGEFSLNVGKDLTINGCGLSSDGRCVSFVGSLYEGTLGVNTTYTNVFAKYSTEGRLVARRTLDIGSSRDPVIDAAGFSDGRIAAALTGKVCILATNGDKLSEFDTTVQTYKRVCVNHRNNNILLSLHKTLQEYDERGRRLRDLSLEPGRTPLNGPHGLCVDNRGNIIVADWSNSRVQMFDKQGEFVQTIAGEEDGLVCPWAVTIPRKGCVAVVDWREHCVFIFRY